jgi:oligopeptidase B
MSASADPDASDAAPVAPARPVTSRLHGTERVDEYGWLREREAAETREYLAAERAYYDARTAHTQPLQGVMADEMTGRLALTDRSVSWSRGGSVYYTETVAGKEYEQLYQSLAGESPARLALDGNLLAEGADYFELGVRLPSPDGRLLAYSVDRAGDEVYQMRFRDLAAGTDLPDVLSRTYYGAAWSADGSTVFYVVHDAAYRPYQVRRHRLGTDEADDVVVLQEDDPRFEVYVETSRSMAYVVLVVEARDTSECWLVPTDRPDEPATVVAPRRAGVRYSVAHAPRPDGDVLVVLTDDGAPEWRVMTTPLATPGREHWVEVIGEEPAERVFAADVFARHVVLSLRRDGSPALRVVRRDGSETAIDIHPGLPAGSIRLGRNEEYDVDSVVVVVESYTEPPRWYSVDLDTGDRTLLKVLDVPGYDATAYVSDRYAVEAPDGTLVPVTVARRADVPLDGTAPCLLYGYGAYEAVDEPVFFPAVPSLLDRGVVLAHAHVRGGGELGTRWYHDGRLAAKQNSFTDLVAAADGLDGLVDGRRIVARGLSAGGLLVAAAYSQAPRRWAGVVAEVPFVDVVTTMLDETIPLTAQEWDEWGDPRRPEDFAWMLAYSPYDNVPPVEDRPPLLVTGAVHDPRVMYWEPAKWVARLRATGSTDTRVLLRMELGAGAHVGPSGRYAHLRYEAEVFAWVLDALGAVDDAGSDGRSASR